MNYEQKYNASLEQAKKELASCGSMDCDTARLIFRLFPQLRESEDERIRNLIYCLIRDRSDNQKLLEHNGVSVDEALAYLEKQKEQKPIIKGWVARDKALQLNFYTNKPKRGKTYWIENGGDSVQIMPDPERLYEKQDFDTLDWKDEPIEVELVVRASTEKSQEHVPENGEMGTSQQKPSELSEEEESQIWQIANNAAKTFDEAFAILTATKKAYDKGRKDAVKEQKPAWCISHLNVQGKGVYKICPRCKERMVRDDSKVYTSMPPQYGYECPKCGEMVFDTVMYDNPEMEEQKPAEWNKNDTVFLNEITDYFENKTVRLQHDLDMYAHWLKSLPERFNLQAKQEWSEVEKEDIDTLISYFQGDFKPQISEEIFKKWMVERLKSLRPQPKEDKFQEAMRMADKFEEGYETGVYDTKAKAWKPSAEQIAALQLASDEHWEPDGFDPLYTLLQDLKAL